MMILNRQKYVESMTWFLTYDCFLELFGIDGNEPCFGSLGTICKTHCFQPGGALRGAMNQHPTNDLIGAAGQASAVGALGLPRHLN